jgi:predicted acetylornithine/succinylornithine family transaminase
MSTSTSSALLALDPWPFMPVFARPKVVFERGRGTELWDVDGKRYLDFLGGLAVTSLGHAHPAVTAALTEQAATLLHVSNLFANRVAIGAAQDVDALLAEVTGCAGQVFFCNSGAEANEAALKLARKHGGRGRHTVVSAYGSFHGRTLATLAATGQPAKHEPFFPMPEGFRHVAYGDLDAAVGAVDSSVAAVLIETVQGEGGVNVADVEYLRGLRELCTERGALLMIDEVQTGFGRTGRWFGFQHAGIVPDVVTMAKAMGNGFPVGAVWAPIPVAAAFEPGDHGSTYSATALAAAVVRAVIAELRRIDAPRLATERGAHLAAALAGVDGVAHVRGHGLLLAAELAPGIESAGVYVRALQAGLVVNAVTPTAIRFAPPINVSPAELDEAVAIFAGAVAA